MSIPVTIRIDAYVSASVPSDAVFDSDLNVAPAISFTAIEEIVRPSQKSCEAVIALPISASATPASASAALTASYASSVVLTSSRCGACGVSPSPTMKASATGSFYQTIV